MRENANIFHVLLLLVGMTLFAGHGLAQIYKWVDEDGNVHFGDKPKDSAQAAEAKPVELGKSYQPPPRTAQEMEAYEKEQQAKRERGEARRSAEKQEQAEAQEKSRREKAALCAAYAQDIEALSTSKMVNGRLQAYYIKGKDGKSLSTIEQREFVDKLRQEQAAAGCR